MGMVKAFFKLSPYNVISRYGWATVSSRLGRDLDFLDDVDHASQFAGDAMRLMAQYRVPPTPQNFAVWYCFVSGRDPGLCKTLDLLIAKGERFTDFQNAAIFERFFGYLKEAATVEETGETMSRILTRVDTLVRRTSTKTIKTPCQVIQCPCPRMDLPTTLKMSRSSSPMKRKKYCPNTNFCKDDSRNRDGRSTIFNGTFTRFKKSLERTD